jgi:hypothetical protein
MKTIKKQNPQRISLSEDVLSRLDVLKYIPPTLKTDSEANSSSETFIEEIRNLLNADLLALTSEKQALCCFHFKAHLQST